MISMPPWTIGPSRWCHWSLEFLLLFLILTLYLVLMTVLSTGAAR